MSKRAWKIWNLATKPASGGRPTQAQEEHRQRDHQTRRPVDQAAEVGELFGAGRVAEEGDDSEGAQVHEQIGRQVEEDRLGPGLVQRRQPRDHEAGMRDRRIGEQALQVRCP